MAEILCDPAGVFLWRPESRSVNHCEDAAKRSSTLESARLFSRFLPDWGLTADDEGPLIDAILAQLPGGKRTVTLEVGAEELSYLGPDLKRVVEPSRFQVMVGGSSEQVKSVGLDVTGQ